ncbi:DUF1990 family protein [Tsukamurella sp. PLM1]|uniref:DUF1990 family protein n=1 Tax=Tsukamurella sp. PLM1 TaxID=2929795 RepID=UPI00206B5D01|nr:DUF1990 family protein [Tsukamurella sp. PLM1]BDH59266.1 hypothetical protein MTP03_42050 [Tsukamurella sp. PLM1]
MTSLADPIWGPGPAGHRRAEITTAIGSGEDDFARAAHDVLRWAVKTRSGFSVSSVEPVEPGRRLTVTARVAGITIRSLTRPAPRGFWRAAYPALLVAQRVARARYVRALRQH